MTKWTTTYKSHFITKSEGRCPNGVVICRQMNEAEDLCSYTSSFLKFAKKNNPSKETREAAREGMRIGGFDLCYSGGGSSISSFSPPNGDMQVLEIAKKMKELGIMDSSDVEYILDLEEALHCYSLLTCPFYRDIVRKFFLEIYSDFSAAVPMPGTRSTDSVLSAGSRCA